MILAVVLVLMLPLPLHAQVRPDSVRHRNNCRLAEQALASGHPAPHVDWASQYIVTCGPAKRGAAIAAAVRRLREATDTVALESIWRHSRFLVDRELFEASMEIAADNSASVQARVFAFLGLLHTTRRGRTANYTNLTGGFDEWGMVRGGCARTVVSGHDHRAEGAPLPPDFEERVRLLSERVRNTPTEPLDVRTAATCTYRSAR